MHIHTLEVIYRQICTLVCVCIHVYKQILNYFQSTNLKSNSEMSVELWHYTGIG
jgi:hypothetical protein